MAIICSMVTVMVFYVLVNVAYYTMMSPAELLQSEAVAVVSDAPDLNSGSDFGFNLTVLPADVCQPCPAGIGLPGPLLGGPILPRSA